MISQQCLSVNLSRMFAHKHNPPFDWRKRIVVVAQEYMRTIQDGSPRERWKFAYGLARVVVRTQEMQRFVPIDWRFLDDSNPTPNTIPNLGTNG